MPWYRRCMNMRLSMRSGPNPWSARSASASRRSRSRAASRPGREAGSSMAAAGSWRSTVTSARPRPYADRMPAYRWMKIRPMPRERAMAQACCGPAPPKVASTCPLMWYPRITEISRMARAMTALATRMYPRATSSTLRAGRPPADWRALISTVSAARASRAARLSGGWSRFSPNTRGK